MFVPPVAAVYWGGLTAITGLVFGVLLPSLRSAAVIVKLPLALKENVRFVVPAASAVAGGRVAVVSVELRPTVSLTVFTRFHCESTALIVTGKEPATVWPLAVPVFALTVPGAATSPGTSNWSLLNGPVLTTRFPEVTLVKLVAVKLSVMVSARLYERLAKVANPLTVVAVRVPCKVAVPMPRATVITRPLSVATRLPPASSTRITGCCANGIPAVAVAEGWVWSVSLRGVPPPTVMVGLVLAVLLPSVRSLVVRVWLPTVLRVTLNVLVPETRAALAGNVALLSEEVRLIVSA